MDSGFTYCQKCGEKNLAINSNCQKCSAPLDEHIQQPPQVQPQYVPPYQPQPALKKKPNGCLIALAIFVGLIIFAGVIGVIVGDNNTDNSITTDKSIVTTTTTNQTTSVQSVTAQPTQPITTQATPTQPKTTKPQTTAAPSETISQKNAVRKAKEYLNYTSFSRTGLIEQLEYEGFPHDDAIYGTDRSGANWNEQAVKKAKEYLEYTSFSRTGLIEQLEYEGFTHEQAVHGVTSNGF